MTLTHMEREILKQAAGLIGRPNYSDHRGMAVAMASLVGAGLVERAMEDDQPTAYATLKGKLLLRELGEAVPS